MAQDTFVQIDPKRIEELSEREEKRLEEATPKSYELFVRGSKVMPMGVASTYQARDPYPVYYSHGKGSKIYSIDGQEISDFHNGFGCMVQGHAHPAIVEAVKKRVELGTQFALPTEDSIIMAEHLARNFKLPKWRFVNSGSEATMDAIRVARAFTGRDTVMKIFGSYHGHHDYVMVSIGFIEYDDRGPRDNYASIPYGGGIPQSVADMTVPVPFNDAPAMEARIERLIEEGRKPACIIMEPVMMNLGVVLPEPGYLQAVRDITKKHGIVLIFDEVKTGICTAPGGATERFGVVPDMVTLAKALAGGLPSGAIGGTDEIMACGRRGQGLPGRHLQRQPALHGGRPCQHGAGHDPGCVQASRLPQRPSHHRDGRDRQGVRLPGLHGRHPLQGLLQLHHRSRRGLRHVHAVPEHAALLPRVALQHQPRRDHRPRSRGRVDAVRPAHRRGHRPLRGGLQGPRGRHDRLTHYRLDSGRSGVTGSGGGGLEGRRPRFLGGPAASGSDRRRPAAMGLQRTLPSAALREDGPTRAGARQVPLEPG